MKKTSAHRKIFAAWLTDQLTRRGYDVAGLRTGGRGRFARDSGISPATVSRLLQGGEVNDIGVLARVADALDRPLGEILTRAGILEESDLQQPPPGARRITPEEAADELGIHDPQQRALFLSMTETLRKTPPPGTGEEHLAEN